MKTLILLIIYAFVGLSFPAFSQVSLLDNTTSTATSFSYAAPAGYNRLLVLGITAELSGADAVTSVTYGGQTFTKMGDVSVSGGGSRQYATLFYLTESAISSRTNNTINITFSSGGGNVVEDMVSLALFDNVNQATPAASFTSNSSNGATSISVATAIASSTNDMVVSATNHGNTTGAFSSSAGFTELHEISGTAADHSFNYRSITANGSYTPGYSYSGASDRMVIAGMRIVAYPTAPGGVTGLTLWLKGDRDVRSGGAAATSGTGVDQWIDNVRGITATQTTAAVRPVYSDNAMNFNPALGFDQNALHYLDVSSAASTVFNKNNTYFAASNNTGGNRDIILYWSNGIDNINAQYDGYGDVGFSMMEHEFAYETGGAPFSFIQDDMATATAWGAASDNNYKVLTGYFTSGAGMGVRYNAFGFTTATAPTAFHAVSRMFIGRHGNFGIGQAFRLFNGNIGEAIVYSGILSAANMRRIESYLAVKYGVTLGSTTTLIDYETSSGTIVWAGTAIYQNDVAGIGRDDASGLNQKQSKSVNSDAILTGSIAAIASSNALNTGSFAANESFLLWGNDNGALYGSSNDVGVTVNGENIAVRLERKWLAQETGTIGNAKLRFNMASIMGLSGAGTNNLANVRLLVDADGIFASNALSIAPTAYDNTTDIVEFDHDFLAASGYYFTIGSINFSDAPLPVELTYFKAEEVNNKVKVSWGTASEINSDYFVVERSFDGVWWESMVVVNAAGKSTDAINYSVTDETAFRFIGNATQIYYRLKQADIDANEKHAGVAVVPTSGFDFISVYPNPADDKLYIAHSSERAYYIVLRNGFGSDLIVEDITTGVLAIDISRLNPGIYLLNFIDKSSREIYHSEKIQVK